MRSAIHCWILLAIIAAPNSLSLATEIVQLNESNWNDLAPTGKEADCIYGDYVIRNEHVVAVIGEPIPTRRANMTVRVVGGCLIDFTSRHNPNDQLSAYYPGGQLFAFAGEPTINADGLTFVGKPIDEQEQIAGLEHRVTYQLKSNDRHLTIRSELANKSDKAIELPIFDLVRADRDFTKTDSESQNAFVFSDYWWNQAYGVTSADRRVSHGEQNKSNLVYFRDGDESKVSIAPGESFAFSRTVHVGLHSAEALGRIAESRGESSLVQISVSDPDGPINGAKLIFKSGDEEVAIARTGKDGRSQFPMPVGKYDVVVSALGRDESKLVTDLNAGSSVQIEVDMNRPAYVEARITDVDGNPIACKVEFDAVEEGNDPFFGPDTFVWEVQNLIYTEDGKFRHALPPGEYNVIISHGNEFDAVTKKLSAKRGETAKIEAQLVKTVATKGWVSADFHSHSTPSGDNTSSQLGRVLNLLAEHIEFAPCTEHNRVSTYEPHIERLGAVGKIATCSGMELTGGPLPVNHQNAFPMHHHPHTQDGGGPRTMEKPVEQIKRLRNWDDNPEKLIQMNHPDLPRIMCDADEDGQPDEGHRGMFEFTDVIEVHPPYLVLSPPEKSNPDNVFGNQMVHWLQMLNLGFRIPGVVNTDSHYTFHGSGWLRNYVKSSTDNPADIDIDEMVKASRKGNLIMTNGPYLEVSASDADGTTGESVSPGDDLAAPSKRVRLSVRVQCANWLDVNRVQVLVNGRAPKELNFKQRDPDTKFRNGVVKFDEEIELSLREDAHIVVAALGEGLGLGPVAGPEHAEDPPCAVSNPIFVDVDGGGFTSNKDLLDIPLPAQLEGLPLP